MTLTPEKPGPGPGAPEASPVLELGDTSTYLNRELSWLRFNERVLEEALDERHPLLERVKFLAIFQSNLDEFFMIRVSGLRSQLEAGVVAAPPDGMTPTEQLDEIRSQLLPTLGRCYRCFSEDLEPGSSRPRHRASRFRRSHRRGTWLDA